jgi:hypothetical protein
LRERAITAKRRSSSLPPGDYLDLRPGPPEESLDDFFVFEGVVAGVMAAVRFMTGGTRGGGRGGPARIGTSISTFHEVTYA